MHNRLIKNLNVDFFTQIENHQVLSKEQQEVIINLIKLPKYYCVDYLTKECDRLFGNEEGYYLHKVFMLIYFSDRNKGFRNCDEVNCPNDMNQTKDKILEKENNKEDKYHIIIDE